MMNKGTVALVSAALAALCYWSLTPAMGALVGLTYLVCLSMGPSGVFGALRVPSTLMLMAAYAVIMLITAYTERVYELVNWHQWASAIVVVSYTTTTLIALLLGLLWVLRAPTNESEEADSPPTNRVGGE